MRYRRRLRRYSKFSKKSGLYLRRKSKSKKSILYAKRLIRKYSLPTTIKNIGMSEKKTYVLRVIQPYSNEMGRGDANHYVYQIILDPTLSPDFEKLYRKESYTIRATVDKEVQNKDINFNLFKYDYLRINKILVVLRPIMSTPNANIESVPVGADDLKTQQYPASPIFGYYTLKNPLVFDDEIAANISTTYGINPQYDKICLEGKNKQVFSFPSNKSLTLNLNTIKFRCNNLSPCVLGNKLWDTQNIGPCQYTENNYYSIFGQSLVRQSNRNGYDEESTQDQTQENNSEMSDDEQMRGAAISNGIDVDAVDQKSYSLNAGRIVLVSKNPYKFTYEIYYHVSCYR